MRSPTIALTWEIWQRGRRSAAAILASLAICVLINWRFVSDKNYHDFSGVFGMLMVLSFGFLLSLLNCTEFNSTRDWNGFPYRLFVLPVPTWKLVAVPMVLGLIVVEGLYFAWVKLVWTHGQLENPDTTQGVLWLGVVLGAWLAYYQTTLWSLAGFRIFRLMVLSVGGVSAVLVAFLPTLAKFLNYPWLSTEHLILIVLATIPIAFVVTCIAVERQRHSGGRRRNFVKALIEWIVDRLPRRTKNFSSPAAAQFWFEWRRTGLLLPAAVAFALLAIFAPLSWEFRDQPHFTVVTLYWIVILPVALAFILGKGFGKADFYSASLSVPSFLGVRPVSNTGIIAARLKVAAVSVLITWLLIALFLAVWLPFWADSSPLPLYEMRVFYPHLRVAIIALIFFALAVLTWRCLIGEMWTGLSGKSSWYFGSIGFQVIGPFLLLTASGIWGDDIDKYCESHPQGFQTGFVPIAGWVLAALIIGKLWLGVLTWSRIEPRYAKRYLFLWVSGTAFLIALAILARPPVDMERKEQLFLLIALLILPFARAGVMPRSLAKNRAG